MPPLLKPERIQFGDTIGIIAPASAPPDARETIEAAVR
jgi:muramoyltetrapeptide carboxypeptidase LdcA involved in peptidoglycan recycling